MARWILLATLLWAAVPVSADPPQATDRTRSQALNNALKNFDLTKVPVERGLTQSQKNVPSDDTRCAHILVLQASPDTDPAMVYKVPPSDSKMPVMKPMPVCPQDILPR